MPTKDLRLLGLLQEERTKNLRLRARIEHLEALIKSTCCWSPGQQCPICAKGKLVYVKHSEVTGAQCPACAFVFMLLPQESW